MKIDEARKLADESLARLADALAWGESEALAAHLATMARFHQYSFGNILLIAVQRPDAARVAGYNTWTRFNRYVRKGERGIAIVAPIRVRRRKEPAGEADGQEEQDGAPAPVVRFKTAYVFDISQTEGEPLPEPSRVAGDPGGCVERLQALVAECGIVLEVAADLGGADGRSSGGKIVLRAGLSPAEEFSTLVHELAHERLHHGPDAERPGRTVRETEAEAVAFVVGEAVGLQVGSASADYIQLYRGDKETLAASLDRIQRTAAEILSALFPDG